MLTEHTFGGKKRKKRKPIILFKKVQNYLKIIEEPGKRRADSYLTGTTLLCDLLTDTFYNNAVQNKSTKDTASLLLCQLLCF